MKLMGKNQQIAWILFLCYIPFGLYSQTNRTLSVWDTFFSYSSDEFQAIRQQAITNEKLTQQKFEKWDPIIYELTENQLPDGLTTRLIAYLYVAQRDFALLSHQITQQWVGNPDSLTVKVLHLVYPDFRPSQPIKEDPYSLKISEIVFRKIEDRFKQEQARLKDYPAKTGPAYWKEEPPVIGQRIGTCKPWLIPSLKDLKANPPPGFDSLIWEYGINQILFDQARLTPEMRKSILYWGGKEGPESGNWFAIVNKDLQEKDLALQEFLFVRAALAMGYVDAMIAVFDSKYTYWVIRPHMRDPKVVQVIICPKHPSYPSAHSVTSSASTTILSYFFPDEKEKWQKLAFEACNSRIWGGLHYMYDNEEGLIQGEKVGRAVIERLANPFDKKKSSPSNLESESKVPAAVSNSS